MKTQQFIILFCSLLCLRQNRSISISFNNMSKSGGKIQNVEGMLQKVDMREISGDNEEQ